MRFPSAWPVCLALLRLAWPTASIRNARRPDLTGPAAVVGDHDCGIEIARTGQNRRRRRTKMPLRAAELLVRR
jgi:hypothetical protein